MTSPLNSLLTIPISSSVSLCERSGITATSRASVFPTGAVHEASLQSLARVRDDAVAAAAQTTSRKRGERSQEPINSEAPKKQRSLQGAILNVSSVSDTSGEALTMENIVSKTCEGLDTASPDMIDQCFDFLTRFTNISFRHKNYERLVIYIKPMNLDHDLTQLELLLPTFKTLMPPDRMHIRFIRSDDERGQPLKTKITSGVLRGFVERHRLYIREFALVDIDPENLDHLLIGTDNLKRLFICSNRIQDAKAVQALTNLGHLIFLRCQSMTKTPDLTLLTKLKRLCFIRCSNLYDAPLIAHLKGLEYLLFRKGNFSPESYRTMTDQLIEESPEMFFKLRLIRGLNPEDIISLQCKLAECHPEVYVDNLSYFMHPDEKACQKAFLTLQEKEDHSRLAQYGYLMLSTITDPKLAVRICRNSPDVEETLTQYGFSLEDYNAVSAYIVIKSIENDDHKIFIRYLNQFSPKPTYFHKIEGNPHVRAFFRAHIDEISKERSSTALIQQLYPPNQRGNSDLYPFSFHSSDEKLCIKCSLFAPLERPEELLKAFFTEYDPVKHKGLSIKFIGNEGLDFKGLSKQFLSRLFQGLILGKNSELAFLDLADSRGLRLPIIHDTLDGRLLSRDELLYSAIGCLLGFLYRSKGEYPIGEMFHPTFFELLLKFDDKILVNEPQMYLKSFEKLSERRLFRECEAMINRKVIKSRIRVIRLLQSVKNWEDLSTEQHQQLDRFLPKDVKLNSVNFVEKKREFLVHPDSMDALFIGLADTLNRRNYEEYFMQGANFSDLTAQARQDFIDLCGYWSIEGPDNIDDCDFDYDSVRKQLIRAALNTRIYAKVAAFIIAKSMKKTLSADQWRHIKVYNGKNLALSIQGEVSKKKCKAMFRADITAQPGSGKLVVWIKQWIGLPSTNLEKLRAVLMEITGSPAIAIGGLITVSSSDKESEIATHTCFNQLSVPKSCSKEMLFSWLEGCSVEQGVFNQV